MATTAPPDVLGVPAANFRLPTTEGRTLTLDDVAGKKGTVIVCICNHCPYVKAVIDRLVAGRRNRPPSRPMRRRWPGGWWSVAGGVVLAAASASLASSDTIAVIVGATDWRAHSVLLDDWFHSDPIKAVLGFDAVVGGLASPYTPGSAYVLLHHVFGEVNAKEGTWGHAIGELSDLVRAYII
jgi:hypothetical protein